MDHAERENAGIFSGYGRSRKGELSYSGEAADDPHRRDLLAEKRVKWRSLKAISDEEL